MKSINLKVYLLALFPINFVLFVFPFAVLTFGLAKSPTFFMNGIFFKDFISTLSIYSFVLFISYLFGKSLHLCKNHFWLFNIWFSKINNLDYSFVKEITDEINNKNSPISLIEVQKIIFKKYTEKHSAAFILKNIDEL